MEHSIEPPDFTGWYLEEARDWWRRQGVEPLLRIIETTPPERRAGARTASRPGEWRVLRCTTMPDNEYELIVAREQLRAVEPDQESP